MNFETGYAGESRAIITTNDEFGQVVARTSDW